MRIALALVLIVVGAVMFPITYRLHKRHPEWAWNGSAPPAWLYALATTLIGIGLVGLALS